MYYYNVSPRIVPYGQKTMTETTGNKLLGNIQSLLPTQGMQCPV